MSIRRSATKLLQNPKNFEAEFLNNYESRHQFFRKFQRVLISACYLLSIGSLAHLLGLKNFMTGRIEKQSYAKISIALTLSGFLFALGSTFR